jgi:prophage antirepressor-like protein
MMAFASGDAAATPYAWAEGRLVLRGEPVEIVVFEGRDDEPWFKAKPVHNFLGGQNIVQTLARVDDEDKASLQDLAQRYGQPKGVVMSDITTPNPEDYHEGKAIYVNESGLYVMALGSKKSEAKAFQRWVTREVLPSIRRTGHYDVNEQAVKRRRVDADETNEAVMVEVKDLRLALIKRDDDLRSTLQKYGEVIQKHDENLVKYHEAIEVVQRQQMQNFKDWLVQEWKTEWKTKICSELSASVCFSLSQKFADLRDALRDAVSNPTGVFVEALRRAVKKPAVKRSTDVLRFPDEQRATPDEERFVESLSVTLTKTLEAFDRERSLLGARPLPALTYGAWKKSRSLIGSRCLALRKKTGDASKPLLWTNSADAGARSNGGGQHYVYLAECRASVGGHAATYVRKVLKQKLKKTRNSPTVEEHIRALIAATRPETWPLSSNDIDAFAHNASEEKLAEEMDRMDGMDE